MMYHSELAGSRPHLISVWVSSADSYSERRLSPALTISELKIKLYPITGISPNSQRLALNLDSKSSQSVILDNDNCTLAQHGVKEGSTIDVVDTDPLSTSQAGQYNDVSQVEKFELPIEEYEKRTDTVRAFKLRNKLGRFNEANEQVEHEQIDQEQMLRRFPINSRCEFTSVEEPSLAQRGTIRYVGPVNFSKKHAVWIGIELDEPIGKNDGSVSGDRYFNCQSSRGIFVLPGRVEVGDFPPIDPFEDDTF